MLSSALAGTASAQVPANNPPGAPALVSPSDGYRFDYGDAQRFTVAAIDPDNDLYSATVTVLDATTQAEVFRAETPPAPSGGRAEAVALPPLPPGRYVWSAHAADVFGAVGPESPSAGFEVGAPAVVGAGGVAGELDYAAPGVPPGPCVPTHFDVRAHSAAAVIDVAFAGYAGPVELRGTGSSSCEDITVGRGTMTLSADGEGPSGAVLSCPVVQGSYTRAGTAFVAELTGGCSVNNFPTGQLTWVYSTQAVAREPGGGVTVASREMTLHGAFTTRSLLLTDART